MTTITFYEFTRPGRTLAPDLRHLYYPIDWIRAEVRSELTRAAGKLKQALRQTLESLDRMESETRRPDKPEEQRA